MDRQGDLPQGDILVRGDTIEAIAPTLPAPPMREVIDARGCIIIPGLVNAHMHTWQTALRGLAANWTLLEYFRKMHAGLATVFTPRGPAHRDAGGGAEPAQLRHHDACRLVPQQPDAGAQRCRRRRPAAIRHPRSVLSRQPQAGSEAGPGAVLGGAASARRGRAPDGCPPGPPAAEHPGGNPGAALLDAGSRACTTSAWHATSA